jgi:hypothetical protein
MVGFLEDNLQMNSQTGTADRMIGLQPEVHIFRHYGVARQSKRLQRDWQPCHCQWTVAVTAIRESHRETIACHGFRIQEWTWGIPAGFQYAG